MLFQVIHVHSHETCPGVHSELLDRYGNWWDEVKKNSSIKLLGGYVAPAEHTFYITIEADDYSAVVRAMGPLNAIGTGNIVPMIPLDAAMPLADQGTFR
jgi:hypothetical protein